MMAAKHETLLVELRTEELPPKALAKLGEAFARSVAEGLEKHGLRAADAPWRMFATPRRLAVRAEAVASEAASREVTEKFLPVAIAFDEAGKPTPAMLKKLQAKGLELADAQKFTRKQDGKAEALFYTHTVAGAKLVDVLAAVVQHAAASLPVPKRMRWGAREVEFVRPVHGLVMLHGADVVAGEVLGLQAGRVTLGHRFLSAGEITLANADEYETRLRDEGKVIAGFVERRSQIAKALAATAKAEQAQFQTADAAALLDEVTALVEWPAVLVGEFEAEYLTVPAECLILTMQANQKYFPLFEDDGRLKNRFMIVSNMEIADPAHIIAGNQRVVRPRLADARFFFEQDKKRGLGSQVEKLARVVYHNRLGSQGERIARLGLLAANIATRLGANAEAAASAARLCKADLCTEMVGEFPELQGIMGRYYAQAAGEAADICNAIEAHYRPRFAGDELPAGALACSLALADKLDALVGFFGINQPPTGERDPYALRRAAIGVLRILMETPLPLDLYDLIQTAHAGYADGVLEVPRKSVAKNLMAFFTERLRGLLREAGHAPDVIDAVLARAPSRIDFIPVRLKAVADFRQRPEAAALAAAHKRIANLLKKAPDTEPCPQAELLREVPERALYQAVKKLAPQMGEFLEQQDYAGALSALAALREPVDAFFADVMVMVEDEALRGNRLALLAWLAFLMESIANFALLKSDEHGAHGTAAA